jgi:tetratricopeptide (TPR) repeat protein
MGFGWTRSWFSKRCVVHAMKRNIYKKQINILIIVIIFPLTLYSNKFIEINGGIGFNNMSEYNSSINDANQAYDNAGYISSLNKISLSGIAELNAGITAKTDLGLMGFYLRNSALINYGDGGKITWPDGAVEQTMNREFSTLYSGLGIRRYFIQEENAAVNFYIGLDAGVYYFFNNSTNRNIYYHDSSLAYTIEEKWSTFFPGGNGEAGLDWRITDLIGLNLRAGYRIGIGGVTVHSSSTNPDYDGLVYKRNADYSGFYIIAGTTLAFGGGNDNGMPRLEYKASEGLAYSEITTQYYNDGVKFFESGSYNEAEKKFNDAKKLDPDNAQISEYLKRISMIRSGQGSVPADKKLELADSLRNAGNIKEALAAYREVLEKDPQNKLALFYTDDFAKKGMELKDSAEKEFAKGKTKKALTDITKAAEYAPDDTATIAMKDKISKAVRDKKETDRLFNEGVDSFQKGDYEKAAELWEALLAITPGDKEAQEYLKKAKEKLAQEGKTEETDVKKIYGEAKDLFDKGILKDARSKCELILRLDQGNTEAAEMIKKMDDMENANADKDVLKKR